MQKGHQAPVQTSRIEKEMTPMSTNIAPIEGMSIEQAGRAADRFQTVCRKEGLILPKDTVQAVLEEEGDLLSAEMFAALRTRVERRAKIIPRHFKVDRTKTPAELLAACKRVPWYIDEAVLATMPTDGPEEGNLIFVPLEVNTPFSDIPKVLEKYGLVPDYAAQMQVNADDPAFADKHPNGMQWDKNSYAYFRQVGDEREVIVRRSGSGWGGNVWFAGRRK